MIETLTKLVYKVQDALRTHTHPEQAAHVHDYAPSVHSHTLLVNYLPFAAYLHSGQLTTSPSYTLACPIDRSLTLLSYGLSLYVFTTNDANNYWNVELLTWPGGTLLNAIDTSGISANTWTSFVDTSFSQAAVTTSDIALMIRCTKAGTPGAPGYLLVPGAAVAYKET